MTTAPDSDNPYVGPRAFRKGEALPGRDREVSGLVGKLLGERILLLHSPSGAGKSSLIQAAVAPRMEASGFQLCMRTTPTLSGLRAGTLPPDGLAVGNRYVYSTVLGLLPDRDPAQLVDLRIAEALDLVGGDARASAYQLLVFDQFEEALILDPADRDAKLDFFQQLGEALEAQHRWTLLAIREDYMGGLDRFARYLPTELRTRYRLDFLERDAALEAIRRPAADRGVTITEDAALALFEDLRKVRRQGSQHAAETVPGPYVEPVQLQVVCHRLWRRLHDRSDGTFDSISAEQIRPFRDIEGALGAYYAEAVQDTAQKTGVAEAVIRDWFETQLIDERKLRRQSSVGPDTGDPQRTNTVLHQLERRYLVRGDLRAGSTWWELTHDRMIEPLLADNQRQLSELQQLARMWQLQGRDPALLLTGDELHAAKRTVAERDEDRTSAERVEREFVAASQAANKADRVERELVAASQAANKAARLLQRANATVAGLTVFALLEAVAIGWMALRRHRPRRTDT